MDISSSGMQPGGVREPNRVGPAESSKPRERRASPQPLRPDEVAISEQAQLLQKLRDAVAESPEDREQKVSALRDAVQQGTYRPSALEIAKAILAYEVKK
jgi:flagellar biosynthesis anti-sigma factor FlgM